MTARTAWPALAIVAVLAAPRAARAHDVHGEIVFLDVGERVVDVELRVPVLALALARGQLVAQLTAAPTAELAADLGAYVGARDRAGRPFALAIRSLAIRPDRDGGVLHAELRLTAPADSSARWFALRDDLVLRRVTTHNAYVFLRRDLQSGALGESPQLLGTLHYQQRSLVVDRTAGSWVTSVGAAFWLGVDHIRAGADHLLFLLMLLLPAPLVAGASRWRGRCGGRRAVASTAKIVTAFTLGHSITLAVGSLGGVAIPAQLVEVLIAVSILVSACHAIRPVFPGREPVVAAAFGLVHGLAFATALAGFGFDRGSLVLALLGFNLGVEAMQFAVIVATIPWLAVVARAPIYQAVRLAGAAFGGCAALGWIVERAVGWHTPVPRLVEAVAAHGGWIIAGLAALATATLVHAWHRGGAAGAPALR